MTDFFILKKGKSDHWYNEPWMLLVLGGPAIVVVAALFTFYLAWHDSDNVVSKDYYKQGINIDKDIHRDTKASEYKMLANVTVDNTGHIQLQLEGKTLPETIQMTVSYFASNSEYEDNQKTTLTQMKPEWYDGSVKFPSQTNSENLKLWHVKVEGPDWRLTGDWHDPLHKALQLKPQY